jgi:preprotein translocase subunit YajC
MFNLISSAQAAEATAMPVAQQNPIMSMVPFVLVFLVLYFLMIKPQKKKLEEEQNFLNSIKKGDEIFTKSGIIGKIVGLTEKVVTLEVSEGTKIKLLKSQVAGNATSIFTTEKTEK